MVHGHLDKYVVTFWWTRFWLRDNDSCDELANDLMAKINQRNQFPKNSIAFSRNESQTQQMMKTFTQRIQQLQQQLIQSSKSHQLTQREIERRQRVVDNLNYRLKQMEISIENPDADRRNALLGNPSQSLYGTNEQDKGLESLAEIISRQKNMAQGIGSEIEIQNEIIDDIGDAMDQTNDRLLRNTRNIRKVNRKSGTCGQF
ncbi:unnamed protein product [Medioppia subpectinata]|uniref:t-SNARE coiled-coil homology domain-containing protein n=1 Tax=Medioppia subpectinata TaxID=1979941 RepID=A0A7R9KNW9_9ACAR|nr:unnamed protein product [Medioppia subpectinata]CAG2105910.1 unnamed protein product [Medioppia subpectinata]